MIFFLFFFFGVFFFSLFSFYDAYLLQLGDSGLPSMGSLSLGHNAAAPTGGAALPTPDGVLPDGVAAALAPMLPAGHPGWVLAVAKREEGPEEEKNARKASSKFGVVSRNRQLFQRRQQRRHE